VARQSYPLLLKIEFRNPQNLPVAPFITRPARLSDIKEILTKNHNSAGHLGSGFLSTNFFLVNMIGSLPAIELGVGARNVRRSAK
jgi:hypothetical protein